MAQVTHHGQAMLVRQGHVHHHRIEQLADPGAVEIRGRAHGDGGKTRFVQLRERRLAAQAGVGGDDGYLAFHRFAHGTARFAVTFILPVHIRAIGKSECNGRETSERTERRSIDPEKNANAAVIFRKLSFTKLKRSRWRARIGA